MSNVATRSAVIGVAALSLGALLTSLSATPAVAAKQAKSTKTEAKFVEFNAADKSITVKVTKPGKKPKNSKLALRGGKPATFRVTPEGSVLSRTSVTLNAKPYPIGEIKKNTSILIYWIPDEKNPDGRYAKKIDLVLSDEEQEALDKARLEAAKATGRVSD
jgi:hypothetical protein